MKLLYQVIFLLIFSAPVLIWYQQTGDLSVYFGGSTPNGQFTYILSKLVGMYALTALFWQIVTTLSIKLKLLDRAWIRSRHQLLGSVIVSLSLLHFLLFATAASIRQGYPAVSLLLPNFSDYYHTHLSFGLLAIWLLLAVVVAGFRRRKSTRQFPAYFHKLYWVAIFFVYLHALAVGSEAQSVAGLYFYGALGFVSAILLVCWIARYKNKVLWVKQ